MVCTMIVVICIVIFIAALIVRAVCSSRVHYLEYKKWFEENNPGKTIDENGKITKIKE